MKAPEPTANEAERLAKLRSYGILDTETEKAFDDLARLASVLCGTPMSAISLIDADRQWLKSGLGLDAGNSALSTSFCGHAIHDNANVTVIEDALADGRFADNPLVTGDPNIRFYAGAPLVTPDGFALGTLCVIDRRPRTLTPEQRAALEALSRQCMQLLELRLANRRMEEAAREREEAMAALEASEAHVQAMTGSALDAIVTADGGGMIISWNPAAEEIFGYTREEMLGQPVAAIMPERYRIPHMRGLARVASGGPSKLSGQRLQLVGLRKDGTEFELEMSLGTWISPEGRFFGAVMRDVTAARRAEAAVRSERDFTAAVLDATEAVTIVTDPEGVITRFNGAAERVSGYRAAEAVGRRFEFLLPPEDAAGAGERFAKATSPEARNRGTRSERPWLRKDGTQRMVSWSSAVLTDAAGAVTHVIAAGIDITERKQAEELLARQSAELRELALRDELTGLHNRRAFMVIAEQHLRQATRQRRPALIVFIDLDGMKPINDRHGHEEGDRALRDTAAVLRAAFRDADVVARLGGDEFVVLLPEADLGALPTISARLEAILAAHNAASGKPYQLAMSLGATCFDPFAPATVEVLLASADAVMYAQKQARRAQAGWTGRDARIG